MSPVKISLSNLTVAYANQRALLDINIEMVGSVIAVIGHNGSGKSTLIKTMLELLEPEQGEIRAVSENRLLIPARDMAFSPENGAVFADLPVESYVRLWCRIKHNDPRYYLTEGRNYLELLEVRPLLRKLGRELSKGQRRRVQTLVGFLCKPTLFLFDEPFEGLDIEQSRILAELMQNESKDRSLLISSHRMEIVEKLADQVMVLNNGQVAAGGTVSEVIAKLNLASGSVNAVSLMDSMAGFLSSNRNIR